MPNIKKKEFRVRYNSSEVVIMTYTYIQACKEFKKAHPDVRDEDFYIYKYTGDEKNDSMGS